MENAMVFLLILVCLILSVIALVVSFSTAGKLTDKIFELEKEIVKLREQIRAFRERNTSTHASQVLDDLQDSSSKVEQKPGTQNADIPRHSPAIRNTEISIPPPPLYTSDLFQEPSNGNLAESSGHSSSSTADQQKKSPPKVEYTPPKKRTSSELEALIGGKLLNRIGALAMIIAVGFFLKYAFDNNWINEWTRVSMGAAFGTGMLLLANYFHRKELTVFAQGLVGVGVSSLYLSVYAAYNFYQLMPQLPAFGLMMGITVIAFLQALKYDSLAAAVMATAGGFLTPLLLPTAHPNEVGLFTYMALLYVGILILVVAKERWVLIEQLARIATYLIYFSWFQEYYQQSDMALTLFHLTLFWTLFFGGEFYKLFTQKLNNRIWLTVGSVMNALAFFIGLMMIIDGPYHEHSGWVTFTLGLVYFGAYQILRLQGKTDKRLEIHYLLSAIVLLILSTGLQFKQYDLVAHWSIQAGVLVWCGVRWRMRFVTLAALVLYFFTVIQLMSCTTFPTYDYTSMYRFVLNDRSLGLWLFILSCFSASLDIRKSEDSPFKQFSLYLLTYGWIALVFTWLTVETNDFFGMYINYNNAVEVWTRAHYRLEMAFGYVWSSYGLLLFAGAVLRRSRMVLQASMIVTAVGSIAACLNSAMYKPILDFVPVVNIRAGLLCFVTVVVAVQLSILTKQDLIPPFLRNLYGIALLVVVFEILSVETFSYYEYQIIEFGTRTGARYYDSTYMIALNNTRQLMLSVVWLMYSIVMMILGFWRKHRGLRLASITLSGIVILKVFIFDLHFLTLINRIISFFGLGVILLLTSYIYQRYKHILLSNESAQGDLHQPTE